MSLIAPWTDTSWTTGNTISNLEVTSYQQHTFNFNGWIKLTQESTLNLWTKPNVTDIKKLISINLMRIIYPCYYGSWTHENPTSNLEVNSYQQQTLNFNCWMK